MRSQATYTRDAALHKLARINRWLIAGSVALTAVLSDVAAQAFPGKPKSAAATAATGSSAHSTHQPSASPGGSLKPPAQAPRTATEASPESAPAQESAPAPESTPAPESAPAQEPAPQESEPAAAPPQESAPAPESAPVQEPSAPVVSGGS
jgi:hypothetical protein